MTTTQSTEPIRILVIDDMAEIHSDFDKILVQTEENALEKSLAAKEAALFGDSAPEPSPGQSVALTHAYQGEEGVRLLREASNRGQPFAMAFVDMRMPPGIDGLETIQRIWEKNPETEVVICSAYSDYSWEETRERLGSTDRLIILKKPFDIDEVRQLASALSVKWQRRQETVATIERVNRAVQEKAENFQASLDELQTIAHGLEKSRAAVECEVKASAEFMRKASQELEVPAVGMVELGHYLLKTQLTEEQRRIVHTMVASSLSLTRTTREIRDRCGPERISRKVDTNPIDLGEFVCDLQNSANEEINDSQQAIVIRKDDALPRYIISDRRRLMESLSAVLVHVRRIDCAADFEAALLPAQTSNGRVNLHLCISLRSRRFELERNPDGAAIHAASGYGGLFEDWLGFSTCQEKVRALGGELSYSSLSKRGLAVRIALDVDAVTAGDPRLAERTSPIQRREIAALLVESSPVQRFVSASMLREQECRVFAVSSTQLGIEALSGHVFDIVFLGLNAADFAAGQAIDSLRKAGHDTGKSTLPLIGIGSLALTRRDCQKLGIVGYLETPLHAREVRHLLDRIALSQVAQLQRRAS
jgi:CheY-like chemotaxis protein